MLLQDDTIDQQFAILSRIAEALQRVCVVTAHNRAAAPLASSHVSANVTVPSVSSSASVLPRVPAGPSANVSGVGDGGLCSSTAPISAASSFFRGPPPTDASTAAASQASADTAAPSAPLQLPRVVNEEALNALRQLGRLLGDATRQLQSSVDAQLLDFYAHLKAKADAAAAADLVSPEARGHVVSADSQSVQYPFMSSTGEGKMHGGAGNSILLADSTTHRAKLRGASSRSAAMNKLSEGASDELGSPTLPRLRTAVLLGPEDVAPPTALCAVITTPPTDFDDTAADQSLFNAASSTQVLQQAQQRSLPYSQLLRGLSARPGSSHASLHNAPMARRLEEERAAATELQSFFSLLLEATLRQTGATAAAVYLSDAPLHDVERSAAKGASCLGNNRSTGTGAAASINGSAAAPSRVQFLQCVAHAHGHFPRTISCAATNVLNTVSQTEIAVNLHYSEASALPRPGDVGGKERGRGAGGGPSTAAPSSYLDMYNGVVVPIKGMGCLVMANKAKDASAPPGALPPRFSVFDEHITWCAAMLSEAVLQRYDGQLLLRATTWAPTCAAVLRPFAKATERERPSQTSLRVGGGGSGWAGSWQQDRRHGDRRSGPKRRPPNGKQQHPHHGSAEKSHAAGVWASDSGATAPPDDLQDDFMSSILFDPQNDIYSNRLTIVRTEDTQVAKCIPLEMRKPAAPSSTSPQAVRAAAAGAGSGASSEQLNDEDLFQAAAQYITNLESLWRKTIADSNTMHTMVDNYNKEMQHQSEKITHLESRVRELNAYVVQLERRNNPSRAYVVT